MKKIIILSLLSFIFILGFSQGKKKAIIPSDEKTKADSLIGKWKYMGAMKTKSIYKTDPAWYHESKATPKFEFIEFKGKNTFNYNEKGKAALITTYAVSKDTVMVDKIKYQIKMIDQKNLTLYRSFYIIKKEDGKTERVDEEQLSFIKVQ